MLKVFAKTALAYAAIVVLKRRGCSLCFYIKLMSISASVVNSYVDATKELLLENFTNELDSNIDCMSQLIGMFKSDGVSPYIKQIFHTSDIYDEMFQAVKSSFWELPKIFLNLMTIMHENRRLSLFPLVIEKTHSACLAAKGVKLAEVVSAQPPKVDELSKLKSTLEEVFKGKILINWRQDSDLIAGFKLKIGPHLIDASLKNRLLHIKERGER
ncbi:MAG: ATP synthase F1 subunit delta [Holosporales bacterium]|jgi:ATP synthase F1 delta subunit|nr:ATP synthase F1 subunit delta [Holosporales bacterium]